ncbi:MAG: hypothetical protein ABIE22_04800 [archaeon]
MEKDIEVIKAEIRRYAEIERFCGICDYYEPIPRDGRCRLDEDRRLQVRRVTVSRQCIQAVIGGIPVYLGSDWIEDLGLKHFSRENLDEFRQAHGLRKSQ